MPCRTRPWALPGLLAVAALLSFAAAQAPAPAGDVAAAPAAAADEAAANAASVATPPADLYVGRVINICTSDYAPISRCLGREPGQFTGCGAQGRKGGGDAHSRGQAPLPAGPARCRSR